MNRRWPSRFYILIAAFGVVVIGAIVIFLVWRHDAEQVREGRMAGCMNQLRNVGLAMCAYANDHDGAYPPSFGELFHDGYICSEYVFCPLTEDEKRYPPDFPTDWKNTDVKVLAKFGEFGSYQMLGVPRFGNRPGVILVCDKPGNHPDGSRMCFFESGHCRLLSREEFDIAMRNQQIEISREIGAKPLPRAPAKE